MTRAMNIEAIEKATGKSWGEWLKVLEDMQARELSHTEIAQKVSEQDGVTSWWAQTIAVAYEQHIGRRQPGQTSDGKYQVAVSRTVVGTLDEALGKWQAVVDGRRDFSGVAIARTPTTSGSDKFRYWHCGLSDGSRVHVGISQKEPGKSVIGLAHKSLKSPKQIDHWRTFWKSLRAMASARLRIADRTGFRRRGSTSDRLTGRRRAGTELPHRAQRSRRRARG